MMHVLAFFSQLVALFGDGMITYSTERYKQLAKRLGRLMRHSLQYVSDYYDLFRWVIVISMLSILTKLTSVNRLLSIYWKVLAVYIKFLVYFSFPISIYMFIFLYYRQNNVSKDVAVSERIALEANILLLKACSYIYRTRNLATWQYFSSLPFPSMDADIVWQIFYYLNVGFPSDFKMPEEGMVNRCTF